jgi:Ca-activated chloride channel family protein
MQVSASFDRKLIWHQGGSVRYLVVEVSASPAEAPKQPVPLNLALVVDTSGSMTGSPLDSALEAAHGVLQQLTGADRLSIVSFASEAQVHLAATAMDSAGRARAQAAVAGLKADGSTNLSAGWLLGAECVARGRAERDGCQNRVLLLSDGHANGGITDPEVLAEHARQLRQRGLYTSTVGIGDGYSPEQILTIANHGGGRMHDAERPQEIIEVVLAELQESYVTAADNLTLSIPSDAGVTLKSLNDFGAQSTGTVTTWSMGSLPAGASRAAVIRVKFPAGEPGSVRRFPIRADWRVPGGGAETLTTTVEARFAVGAENDAQPRDIPLSEMVAGVWQAYLVRHVVRLNRAGRFDAAVARLKRDLPHFKKYCAGLPGGPAMVAELRKMQKVADRDWNERGRKEMELAMYQRSSLIVDARSAPRPSWDSYLPQK